MSHPDLAAILADLYSASLSSSIPCNPLYS